MFGKKKKTTPENAVPQNTQDQFIVHTMKDDINAIENGVEQTEVQPTTQSPFDTIKEPPKASTLQVAATKTPTASLGTAPELGSSDKKLDSNNPFFNATAPIAAVGSPPVKKQSPAPQQEPTKKTTLSPQITLDRAPTNSTSSRTSIEQEVKVAANAQQSGLAKKPDKDLFASALSSEANKNPNASKSEVMFNDQTPRGSGPLDIDSLPQEVSPKKSSGGKKVLWIIISLLLIGGLIAAGFFGWIWWNDKQGGADGQKVMVETPDPRPDTPVDVSEPEIEPRPAPEPEVIPYATDFPNYIEISDAQQAQQDLEKKMAEIKRSMPLQNITTPISFLVIDKSATPLTLRAFSTVAGLSIPDEILSASGDAFEIYAVYNDGDVRFGLGFDYSDKIALTAALKKNELLLPTSLTALFGGSSYQEDPNGFGDNVYGDYAIRFMNLTEDESLSIDYTVADRVYIGTSQKSQRAILDRFASSATKKVLQAPTEQKPEDAMEKVASDKLLDVDEEGLNENEVAGR